MCEHTFVFARKVICPAIDFSINGLNTGGYFKDVNITMDPQQRAKLK